MKDKIRKSNIVFFTGGYPDKMMKKFYKYDLVKELESFNGIMIGASAGAMVQIKEYHITQDFDYKQYSYQKGLNIIKDFDLEVHFNNTEIQNISILRSIREKKKPSRFASILTAPVLSVIMVNIPPIAAAECAAS